MPKIIENLDNLLMAEAERQVRENGYRAVTIRSVANAVGVGVGTVYNYFPSKDALLASYMLRDWKNCLADIQAVASVSQEVRPVLSAIYDGLCAFAHRHHGVIQDADASTSFAGSFRHYHGMLRSQLAEPLKQYCPDAFTGEFVAEALLTWTMAGKEFDVIYGMIQKLL